MFLDENFFWLNHIQHIKSKVSKILERYIYVVMPYWSIKGLGKTVRGSGKLEFEKDCEFDDITGQYVLWKY